MVKDNNMMMTTMTTTTTSADEAPKNPDNIYVRTQQVMGTGEQITLAAENLSPNPTGENLNS